MLPAFGTQQARALLPLFRNTIEKVVSLILIRVWQESNSSKVVKKWKDAIAEEASGKSIIIDVSFWLNKATMDA